MGFTCPSAPTTPCHYNFTIISPTPIISYISAPTASDPSTNATYVANIPLSPTNYYNGNAPLSPGFQGSEVHSQSGIPHENFNGQHVSRSGLPEYWDNAHQTWQQSNVSTMSAAYMPNTPLTCSNPLSPLNAVLSTLNESTQASPSFLFNQELYNSNTCKGTQHLSNQVHFIQLTETDLDETMEPTESNLGDEPMEENPRFPLNFDVEMADQTVKRPVIVRDFQFPLSRTHQISFKSIGPTAAAESHLLDPPSTAHSEREWKTSFSQSS